MVLSGGVLVRILVIASGSKGNAIYVGMGNARFLIDAGVSQRRIRKALASIGESPERLTGILLTHEHRDHIAGLKTLERQCSLPIFSRRKTLMALPRSYEIPETCMHAVEEPFRINGVDVTAFNIPHDAAAPVGWRLEGDGCFVSLTDLGFVTSSVQSAIEGADVLVIEANHDPDMLRDGSYPWPLKQRILGNRGHLANSDAAWALLRMRKKPEAVFLAHLSEHNNTPEVAQRTVSDVLMRQGQEELASSIRVACQTESVGGVFGGNHEEYEELSLFGSMQSFPSMSPA